MTKTTAEIRVTEVTEINLKGAFADFKGMVANYIKNHDASLEFCLFGATISKMDEIHRLLFMMYLLEYWNAYTMDIINGEYNYVNLTGIVYASWLEHMAN